MNRLVVYILISFISSTYLLAQSVRVVASLPDNLKENSGMVSYDTGILYFINDGGNPAELHRFDTFTEQYSTIRVTKTTNVDWEDLAKDNAGRLFIGDFGNNENNRRDLKIYKVPNPETRENDTLIAETIYFSYENQLAFPPDEIELNFDCEAMIWYKDSLYLFSKNRTKPFDGWCYMYVLPDKPGAYEAKLRDKIQLDAISKEYGWITAADIIDDTLALLSSSKVSIAGGFLTNDLAELEWNEYNVGVSQKEAVAFGANAKDVFISDELFIIGNKLYLLDIELHEASLYFVNYPSFKVWQTGSSIHLKLKKKEQAMVNVYSIMGEEVYTAPFLDDLYMDNEDLVPGNYIIHVKVSGENYSFRWTKTE
ncbi:T9SS type A sorting domain-containing protein [Bacteroidia bacterium]|nr:T9SS type A sorting domain-containing protein [Bacteroidia bacterium]MDB9881675.1 T9SS type A sorting domain-containing protein [Bacteroidia bacterium]MDC1395395.1 T9SS type A sorting domain-containing protein [Bacteroidia bacterium]